MKLKPLVAAIACTPALSACETTDWDTLGDALSLYSDLAYISGDCPFGLHKTYDREGHHYRLGEPGAHVDRYDGSDQHGGKRHHRDD